MRRMSLAVVALVLAIVSVPTSLLTAQSQDPTLDTARQLTAQGSHDAAITLLRDALAARRADRALRLALADALEQKRAHLMQQASAISDEVAALRSSPAASSCEGRAPVRVGGAIAQPRRTSHVNAAYPAEALEAKVEGVSIIEILVGCAGEVAEARVLRGVPMLDPSALDAVRQWRYTPTLLNGVPVPVVMTVSVTFTLRR